MVFKILKLTYSEPKNTTVTNSPNKRYIIPNIMFFKCSTHLVTSKNEMFFIDNTLEHICEPLFLIQLKLLSLTLFQYMKKQKLQNTQLTTERVQP